MNLASLHASRDKQSFELTEEQMLALELAEEATLAAPPRTLEEAARIVTVLIENEGERTDGLDRLALHNLLAFLQTSAVE